MVSRYSTDILADEFYSHTKFMRQEHMALDELKIGLLRNQVHPLFSNPLQSALPEYSVVEQSAKLASHFVECGSLDRIFLAIWDNGQHGRGWRSTSKPNEVGYEYPPETLDETVPITPADRIRVRNLLKALSDNIYYRLDKTIDHALTHSLTDEKVTDKAFSKGERSRVVVPPECTTVSERPKLAKTSRCSSNCSSSLQSCSCMRSATPWIICATVSLAGITSSATALYARLDSRSRIDYLGVI